MTTITFTLDRTSNCLRVHRPGKTGTFSVLGLVKLWGFVEADEDVKVVVDVVDLGPSREAVEGLIARWEKFATCLFGDELVLLERCIGELRELMPVTEERGSVKP